MTQSRQPSSRFTSPISHACHHHRWMRLLALLLLLVVSAPSTCYVRANEEDDVATQDLDVDDVGDEVLAEMIEPEVEAEPTPEPVPESEPEPVEEKVAEPTHNDRPTNVPVPDGGSSKGGKSALKPLADKAKAAVDKLVSQGKAAVDRVKKMSKNDAKKVAAAALGIWGVSVGVGWLAQTAGKN